MTEKPAFHYYILWAVAIISLTLNIVILVGLLSVRQQAGLAFTQAAAAVGEFKEGNIEYSVPIDEEIPLALDVPVKFTVEVPINETIPIDTIVNVPLDFPLIGRRVISIPITTQVPLKLTVKVPVDKTIPVNATIPVKFDVPLQIKIADTPLSQGLTKAESLLLDLAKQMGAGGQ